MNEKAELSVDGKTLHLSNLSKLMYPETGFTKGQMIDYYIRISSALLPHLKNRPITLKRYPDGVTGEYFYEKRAPSHTPPWVQTTLVERSSGKPDILAILINDLPSLIWSANLANLELHTPLACAPRLEQPTMVVFDLDPGPPANVIDCARVALWIREFLDTLKLPCFAKTSGSKGMQLYVPLNAPHTYEQTRGFAKAVGDTLRRDHRDSIVVEMAKHLRTGKVFIDYSQNASRKTTVCVYALRAAHSTPYVSTPVTWKELERAVKKNDPQLLFFEPDEVVKRVQKDGDLFEPLLKLKNKLPVIGDNPAETRKGTGLRAYNAKRDFTKTQEPPPEAGSTKKEAPGLLFVIQKHEASRLHYDFRLEMEGVLRSWAVPKGIPTTHEDKRLAMHVEDHPMAYARFEGIIPKGNYGAGTVMVWDIGTYTVKDGDPVKAYRSGKISVVLRGKKLDGEWTLFRIGRREGEREWMLLKKTQNHPPITAKKDDESAITGRTMKRIASDHDAEWISNRPSDKKKTVGRRAAPPQPAVPAVPNEVRKVIQTLAAATPKFVDPMQSRPVSALPERREWIYEIKLDGYRALAIKQNRNVDLISRNAKKMNSKYPEIVEAMASFPAESCVLDGEIVVLDENGAPAFQLLEGYTPKQSKGYLCYYAFDVLNVDGKDTSKLPLEKRKELLHALIPSNDDVVRYSVSLEAEPQVLAREVRKRGLEGIVAKKRTSLYEPGRRSGSWVKWKADNAGEFVIGGYQTGGKSGLDRIIVGQYDGNKLMYVSRVRAGFTPHQKTELLNLLSKRKIAKCPFVNLPEPSSGKWGEGFTEEDMKECIWVKPGIECRVEFTEWTTAGHLRHAKYAGIITAASQRR